MPVPSGGAGERFANAGQQRAGPIEQTQIEARLDRGQDPLRRNGRIGRRDLLVGSLRRIERDTEGLPIKLYPWTRSTDEPGIVEIDAFRSFGRLVLVGTGIPTEVIAGRFNAGETIKELAEDFRLSPAQIEAAIRWERPIESAA